MKKHKRKETENDKLHEDFTGKNMPDRNSEEKPDRQGPDASAVKTSGKNYEPDKDDSGAQGSFGQGNRINKGSEGAQGYGKYEQ
jgi:hypothetical protein